MYEKETNNQEKKEASAWNIRPRRVIILTVVLIIVISGAVSTAAFLYREYSCREGAKESAITTTKWIAATSDNEETIRLANENSYPEESYYAFYNICKEVPVVTKALIGISGVFNL